MFAIESWPDPVVGHGPRVRASGGTGILTDLVRSDLDLVIWTRQVPVEWKHASNDHYASVKSIVLSGPLTKILSKLKDKDFCAEYPDFVIEDVSQIAALVAAFAVSDRLTLHLGPEPDTAQITSLAKLKALCCYGESSVGWGSGPGYEDDFLSFLEPFAVAFIPSWSNDRVHIQKKAKNPILFLTLIAL
ncbi:hypothetical protein GFGA_1d0695 [Gluconobacter frateurii NBRC 103465]|nr:hypothetical protein GFGA_1d0695 [Gluconobacter frateurii NBRC 103465]